MRARSEKFLDDLKSFKLANQYKMSKGFVGSQNFIMQNKQKFNA